MPRDALPTGAPAGVFNHIATKGKSGGLEKYSAQLEHQRGANSIRLPLQAWT